MFSVVEEGAITRDGIWCECEEVWENSVFDGPHFWLYGVVLSGSMVWYYQALWCGIIRESYIGLTSVLKWQTEPPSKYSLHIS